MTLPLPPSWQAGQDGPGLMRQRWQSCLTSWRSDAPCAEARPLPSAAALELEALVTRRPAGSADLRLFRTYGHAVLTMHGRPLPVVQVRIDRVLTLLAAGVEAPLP